MPRVPTVDGQQIRTQALPTARLTGGGASEAAFGGGNEETSKAFTDFSAMVNREKNKADELAALEADTKATRIKNNLFYDPTTGAMNKRGKDAFGAVGEYTKQWDASVKEIEDGLSNGQQRALFRQRAAVHGNDLNNQLQKHAMVEGQAFDTEQTQARVSVAGDEAVLNYNDPTIVGRNLLVQEAELKKHGERLGLPAERVQELTAEAKSKTHSQIIERMITNGEDIQAEQYVKANKDQFTGQDFTRVEKILEDGTTRGGAQRFTDDAMKRGLTMSQTLEETKKIENPKLRDATVSHVREEFSLQKIAKEDQQKKTFDNAANILEGGKGDLKLIKPSTWSALDMHERQELETRSKQLRQGTPAATNWDKYYEFKSIASSPDTRSEFLRTNLMQHRSEFADPEFKEMVNLQTSLRNGKGDAELDGFRTQATVVKDTLQEMGIKDKKQVAQILRSVDAEVISTQKNLGRKVSREETQGIVDNLLVEGVTKKGFLWDTKKRVYELQEGDNMVVRMKDIPRGDKIQIEQALKNKNIPVNEENVVRLYTERHLSKKPGA